MSKSGTSAFNVTVGKSKGKEFNVGQGEDRMTSPNEDVIMWMSE